MTGPLGYENWRAQASGAEGGDSAEFTFYSDSLVRAEVSDGLGPFKLLNPVGGLPDQRYPGAHVVLRAQMFITDGWEFDPDPAKSDAPNWHGGHLDEELAALCSLSLGIRMRSGGLTRLFDGRDPLGVPVEYAHTAPSFVSAERSPLLPRKMQVDLQGVLPYLPIYPQLSEDQARSLLRAARSYQMALWNTEFDPEYAWLKLVSALEAAADCWWGGGEVDPVEALKAWNPTFHEGLTEYLPDDQLYESAKTLLTVTRSTKKFLDFCRQYCPPEPEIRPDHSQVEWGNLVDLLGVVYRHRSRSLHEARPFPGPLLGPPQGGLGGGAPLEMPIGAVAINGNTWALEDLPMYLHVFAYVAREILVRWWASGCPSRA